MILTLSPPSIYQKAKLQGPLLDPLPADPHNILLLSLGHHIMSPFLPLFTLSVYPTLGKPPSYRPPPLVFFTIPSTSVTLYCPERLLRTNSLVSISTLFSNCTCFFSSTNISNKFSFILFSSLNPWITSIASILTVLFVTANALNYALNYVQLNYVLNSLVASLEPKHHSEKHHSETHGEIHMQIPIKDFSNEFLNHSSNQSWLLSVCFLERF